MLNGQYFGLVTMAHRFKKLDILNRLLPISEREAVTLFAIAQMCHLENEPCGSGEVKVSELAERLEISVPACSTTLNIIEEKGWVERYSDKSDRRAVYLRLSGEGIETIRQCRDIIFSFLDRVSEKCGDDKILEFTSLSNLLLDTAAEILNQ